MSDGVLCVSMGQLLFSMAQERGLVKAGEDQRGKKVAFKKEFRACLCKGVCVISNKPLQMISTCAAFAFLGLPV